MDAKILIVDDELAMPRFLDRFLVNAGYECQLVERVASAKEILVVGSFDLLLSDLKISGELGLDPVRHAQKHYPWIGRITITGYGSPGLASEVMMGGVYEYLSKSVPINVVLITVKNVLRHLHLHMPACKVELEKNVSQRTERQQTRTDYT